MSYESPTDLDGAAESEEKRKQLEQTLRRQFEQDFTWLLAHRQGRRLVWWLMAEAGVFRNPWNENASAMAFAAGSMNVGQRLLSEIFAVSPDAFNVMLKESQDDARRKR
jgi:hypothetical protein